MVGCQTSIKLRKVFLRLIRTARVAQKNTLAFLARSRSSRHSGRKVSDIGFSKVLNLILAVIFAILKVFCVFANCEEPNRMEMTLLC